MPDDAVVTVRAGRLIRAAGHAPEGPHAITIAADGRIRGISPITGDRLSPEEAGLLLTPALANAHDHGRGLRTLAFGADDQPLETWLPDLGRQPYLDPYACAVTAFTRMARSGIGIVNHCHNTQDGRALLAEAEAVSRAARDTGVRVAFCWPFFDANPVVYGGLEPLAAHMDAAEFEELRGREAGMRDRATNVALMEQARAFEHALFSLQFHPVAPQWVQPATLAAIAQASAQEDRRVHMHLLETRHQRAWADRQYPDGIIRHFDGIGLLSPRLTVAHGVWLRPEECTLLADRGVTVVLNLSSNLRLRSGLPPMAALRAAGAPLAFGLDGMSLDDDEDMLRELRLAYHLAGATAGDARPLSATDVLKGAWETGRRSIVGDDGGGRITVGAPADLLGLDFAAMAEDAIPSRSDVLSLLLGRAQQRHVRLLLINGRPLVQDGKTATPPVTAPLFSDRTALSPERESGIESRKALMKAYYALS